MSKKNLTEADVTPDILQSLEASGCRIYRNNVGVARYGHRWVAYGMGGSGAADFIGYLPVRVTEDMVGSYIAVFCSFESKRPVGARYSERQCIWRDNILAAGGIAGFVHGWEQGRALIMDFYARFKKKQKVKKKKVSKAFLLTNK